MTDLALTDRALAQIDALRVQRRETTGPLVVEDIGVFLASPIPPREPILAPIILEQSLTMIHSWRGVGKTHVALAQLARNRVLGEAKSAG